MEDNNDNLWCDEMADFIMDNLFPEFADDLWPEHKTINENGELPVLWDDDGDPIFFLKDMMPFHCLRMSWQTS